MFEKFCPECLEYTHCEPYELDKSYDVRGEKITIRAHFLKCQSCDEIIPDKELQDRNFNAVYSEYRSKKRLLSPAEITDIRNKYDLSQRLFAKILGWGHATLSKYESGALQSVNHNNELVLLKESHNMLTLFELNSSNISGDDYEKIKRKIVEVIEKEKTVSFRNFFLSSLKFESPSIYNGYARFDLDKLTQTIKFFALNDGSLWKVKLMKYLFYSDFLNFKRYTVSINGLKYVNLKMGPVPSNYDQLLLFVIGDKVAREYIAFPGGGTGELFSSIGEVDWSVFSEGEMDTLHTVLVFGRPHTTTSISELSHLEDAWKNTKERQEISYEYATTLSLN